MKLEFRVDGYLPPKKDGAQSMWNKKTEAERLIRLRQAAFDALQGIAPLRQNIKLSLGVYVGPSNNRAVGDLDNFIAGVCDGLQAANEHSKLHSLWTRPELAHIHPGRALAIADDSQVISIVAERVITERVTWYEVILESE